MKKNFTSLKSLNTFAIDVVANQVVIIHDELGLFKFWNFNYKKNTPFLVLGSGSNVLFLENYSGIVLLNRIKGLSISENKMDWKLHIGAGEKWSELVSYTLKKNIPGLENLACIPGCVGSAIIQNIGAYGVELSDFCEYVDVLDLNTGKKIRFACEECDFRYRYSIFKNCRYKKKYIVISVGLRLHKNWKPILHYPELSYLLNVNIDRITPDKIFNTIYSIRKKKIPDPFIVGNAGSFFKNPIISAELVYFLMQKYPDIPCYWQSSNKVKLSAGWLIEQCQLKGCIFGEAAVYKDQASILINNRKMATGTEIIALALYIYNQILDKFNIFLEPEVVLIGNYGEIDPIRLFKS